MQLVSPDYNTIILKKMAFFPFDAKRRHCPLTALGRQRKAKEQLRVIIYWKTWYLDMYGLLSQWSELDGNIDWAASSEMEQIG